MYVFDPFRVEMRSHDFFTPSDRLTALSSGCWRHSAVGSEQCAVAFSYFSSIVSVAPPISLMIADVLTGFRESLAIHSVILSEPPSADDTSTR